MERRELEGMTREELIALAERVGVTRPRVLTLAELSDEILSRTARSDRDRARARGWLGRARDLLAGVVERGLHLPEVAQMLRTTPSPQGWPPAPAPLATLTLAEIYAAQGHLERALGVLDEVLAREPEHHEASALRAKIAEQLGRAPLRPQPSDGAPALEPVPETAAVPVAGEAAPATPAAAPDASAAPAADAPPLAEPDEPATLRGTVEPTTSTPPPTASTPPAAASTPPPAATPSSPPAAASPSSPPRAAASPSSPPRASAPPPTPAAPERWDVDEIVAIAVDPRTLYLYWEVRPATLARADARRPDGALVVRVVSVTPTWDGPVVRTRDLRVGAAFGDEFVRDVEPGSSVRVSVGWLAHDDFEPFAVGIELSAPHLATAEPIAREVGVWSAEPAGPPDAPAATAPYAAHAVAAPAPRAEGLPARLREVAMAELAHAGATPPARGAAPAGAAPPALAIIPSPERLAVLEQWRVRRIGSSELVRELERTILRDRDAVLRGGPGAGEAGLGLGATRPGGAELGLGGSSELGPGGASELARRR